MQIFITKFKSNDNKAPNYFQPYSLVYVDHLVLSEPFDDSISEYTDEIISKDNIFKWTASDYDFYYSLLTGELSASGKTIEEFFDPKTDGGFPVGYKIAFGKNQNNIERADFIDVTTIKIDDTYSDEGQVVRFTVIGAEEELIRRAELLPAPTISYTGTTQLETLLERLVSESGYISRVTVFHMYQSVLMQRGVNFTPIISPYIYNRCINYFSQKDRWYIFLLMLREHALTYRLVHFGGYNPAELLPFRLFIIFHSQGISSNPAPEFIDSEYIISNNHDYSKENYFNFYVSYTSIYSPKQDILATGYIDKNEATIGYADISSSGWLPENHQNNCLADYNWTNKVYLRYRSGGNNHVLHEELGVKPDSPRVSFPYEANSSGINIGVSLGRSVVQAAVWLEGGNYYDQGFNQIITATALSEYKFLAAGILQSLEGYIEYPLNSPYQLNTDFVTSEKNNIKKWKVIRITERDTFNETAKILCIEVPIIYG